MSTNPIPISNQPEAKSYFGITALIISIISDLFLGVNFGVAYLRITPGLFSQLNNLTALIFCALTPLAFTLGVVGHVLKNDSKTFSRIAIALAAIPFGILFIQFVSSFVR